MKSSGAGKEKNMGKEIKNPKTGAFSCGAKIGHCPPPDRREEKMGGGNMFFKIRLDLPHLPPSPKKIRDLPPTPHQISEYA